MMNFSLKNKLSFNCKPLVSQIYKLYKQCCHLSTKLPCYANLFPNKLVLPGKRRIKIPKFTGYYIPRPTSLEVGSFPFVKISLRNSGIVLFLVFASHAHRDECFWLLLDQILLQPLINCVISHFTISLYTSSVKIRFVLTV